MKEVNSPEHSTGTVESRRRKIIAALAGLAVAAAIIGPNLFVGPISSDFKALVLITGVAAGIITFDLIRKRGVDSNVTGSGE